jgi:hypothetical protein
MCAILLAMKEKLPIPPPRSSLRKYPFHDMKVGDDLFVADATQAQMWACFYRIKTMKFTTRKEQNGVRVWRTA